jgi:hypothetical protein
MAPQSKQSSLLNQGVVTGFQGRTLYSAVTSPILTSPWTICLYNPQHQQRNNMKTENVPSLESQLDQCAPEWARLFTQLIPDIDDDYRASDDPDDDTPGMCVTIGFTPATPDQDYSWHYQTGDNSFSGGAYGHPHWAVVSLYRDSDPKELADDCAGQIAELFW